MATIHKRLQFITLEKAMEYCSSIDNETMFGYQIIANTDQSPIIWNISIKKMVNMKIQWVDL